MSILFVLILKAPILNYSAHPINGLLIVEGGPSIECVSIESTQTVLISSSSVTFLLLYHILIFFSTTFFLTYMSLLAVKVKRAFTALFEICGLSALCSLVLTYPKPFAVP